MVDKNVGVYSIFDIDTEEEQSYLSVIWKHFCAMNMVTYSMELWTVSCGIGLLHQGSTGRQKHFLQTAYHQIWLPLTYIEVKCHFTAETVR